ncbi:50S ribosomal protein L4 [Candidatus Beckwithbacteria bacterium]|nr:50S ribosomal protein L4 [Candidatus Beckwithbacteria bacterium]
MKIPVFDLTGKQIEELTLNKAIFEAKANPELLAQAIRIHQSNQRAASASTKTRSDIARTGKKLYRQKGTGGARHGDKKAPIFVGGSKAHGPKPTQHFRLKFPKKMRREALKSALSVKASDKAIIVIAGLDKIKQAKTKDAAGFIQAVYEGKKQRGIGLVLTQDLGQAQKAFRNLPIVTCLASDKLTSYEVLKAHQLVFAKEALEQITKRLS